MNLFKKLGIIKESPVELKINRTGEHEAKVTSYNPLTGEEYCSRSVYIFISKEAEYILAQEEIRKNIL